MNKEKYIKIAKEKLNEESSKIMINQIKTRQAAYSNVACLAFDQNGRP